MLAASSGMDIRGTVLRTLRPVGRSTSRDSGTRIMCLRGSAACSTFAAVWTAWASVWVTAFMMGLQSNEK